MEYNLKKSIEEAENILIFSGAGMSADCGLSTYIDASKEWRNTYKDMMTRKKFESSSDEAWNFYNERYLEYTQAEPHQGYIDLYKIICNKNYFIVSSNIDITQLSHIVNHKFLYKSFIKFHK